jgi:hypothetical protein
VLLIVTVTRRFLHSLRKIATRERLRVIDALDKQIDLKVRFHFDQMGSTQLLADGIDEDEGEDSVSDPFSPTYSNAGRADTAGDVPPPNDASIKPCDN